MSNPSEKSGNTVAIWLVQELTDRHNVAAKDIWKELPGICIARAIKNDMVLILNWICGLLIRVMMLACDVQTSIDIVRHGTICNDLSSHCSKLIQPVMTGARGLQGEGGYMWAQASQSGAVKQPHP